MQIKKLTLFVIVLLFFYNISSQAGTTANTTQRHPLYVGAMGGYGSTTWVGLVPGPDNIDNVGLRTSTPIRVDEGGGVWGFFAGYQFIPMFALEVSYMRYPGAKVIFDPEWFFSEDFPGMTEFLTHTETVSFIGKLMIRIPNTTIKAYSSVGGAGLHRSDIIIDEWRLTPTFGGGFIHDFNEHIMGELGANYTAGYGEAQLNPADGYFPFLYSAFVKLAYRF